MLSSQMPSKARRPITGSASEVALTDVPVIAVPRQIFGSRVTAARDECPAPLNNLNLWQRKIPTENAGPPSWGFGVWLATTHHKTLNMTETSTY